MRKRLLWFVGLIVLLTGLGGVTMMWLYSPRPGLTRENAHRFRYGMTIQQMQSLLGSEGIEDEHQGMGGPRRWETGEGEEMIQVIAVFDDQGRLMMALLQDADHAGWQQLPLDDSFTDKLRRWLGL
jgi:hypothetical protein